MPVAPSYWAKNCIAISPSGLPAPTLPPAPGVDPGVATSCAWVPVNAPLPLSNLKVVKTALDGGKCHKLGGDVIGCDYEVKIINEGPSPFHDSLSFKDDVPAAATIAPLPAPWVCFAGPPPLNCGTVGPVDIPVGGSFTVPVSVTIPLAPLEAAGCGMPNTATLTVPAGGTPTNFFGGDDAATATADAFLTWEILGFTITTCDPTNLKVSKTANGDCVASAGGYRCEYTVRVTNMGPDPHKDEIVLEEQFGFAPSSVTFSPEWTPAGSGSSFTLTHPPVDLEKGESVELNVTANVPEGKQCKLKNTATLTSPPANTRWNGDGSDDAASATANIPSRQCLKPERPRCEPSNNELRSESGACVCEPGYFRGQKGECVTIGAPRLCPDGKPVPKSGRCPVVPPQCTPGPNEQLDPNGQCVCKRGFKRDEHGRCVAPPAPEDECEEKGWIWNSRTRTCLPPTPSVAPRLPAPPTPCVPGTNEVRNAQGQCVCKAGFRRDAQGRCVKPTTPERECRERGWIWNGRTKRCLPPTTTLPTPCVPGRNEVRTPQGQCVCKPGSRRDAQGQCLPATSPEKLCKQKGWSWNRRTGTCQPPQSRAKECRDRGWTWDGQRCLPPRSAAPTPKQPKEALPKRPLPKTPTPRIIVPKTAPPRQPQ
jgi:hypothetical protein